MPDRKLKKTKSPDTVELYRAMDLQGRGGFPSLGDLDGDGRVDFLFSAGRRYRTALSHDGEVLWTIDHPDGWLSNPNYAVPANVYDIDGDGNVEVLCMENIGGRDSLCILEGKTGELKHCVPWPTGRNFDNSPKSWDNIRARIFIANFRGEEQPRDLYVAHYWDIGDNKMRGNVYAMNDQLEIMWDVENIDMAHYPVPGDIDNDGRDEIAAGGCIINDDGTVLWEFDIEEFRSVTDEPHIDGIVIEEIDGNIENGKEVAITSGATLFDSQGRALWNHKGLLTHSQRVQVGKVRPDLPGAELLYCETSSRGGRVYLIGSQGSVIWNQDVLRQDANFINWTGAAVDEVVLHLQEGMALINGYKEEVEMIRWDDPLLESLEDYENRWTPSETGRSQCPPTHCIFVRDVTGDEREEILISNENLLLIFTNAQESRNETKAASFLRKRSLYNVVLPS